ncbi:hypothetical protein BDR03DRAFT_967377 [Suillus americanus]|nr:hypothetical protein BDR03DRAFT_967377 [Suillus americanus]
MISFFRSTSYFVVASSVVVIHDWVLTLGREVELVWRQRWSLMTILYLSMRYTGIPYAIINMLSYVPSVSWTDVGCNIINYTIYSANVIITAMLGAIMIARLYAMYQGSRKVLVFLVVIFLAVNITSGVVAVIVLRNMLLEESILSGTYQCTDVYGDDQNLFFVVWILNTAWEILTLCLSVWIAVKQFRDLRRFGTSTFGDCLTVLIKSHVLYFASFFAASCLNFGSFAPTIENSVSMGAVTYNGSLVIIAMLQMFVLGPRLILSVREYQAKLVGNSDAEIGMSSITFQEHVYVSTSSCV